MKFARPTPGLAAEIENARTLPDLNAAMSRISKLTSDNFGPGATGNLLFLPDLDRAVPAIAARLGFRDRPGERSNDNVCIIATQLAGAGGHSRVAADIVRLIGPDQITMIMTDLYRSTTYRDIAATDFKRLGLDCHAFLVLKSQSIIDRTIELNAILNAIRPTRIFLLHYQMDICAVTAAWPFRSITELVHHTDHDPSLGASLDFAAHVDLTHTCHLACREAGIDAIYAAMTLPGGEVAPPRAIHRPLRFATSGAPSKFMAWGRYRWAEWAAACLAEPDSQFLHIGLIDPGLQRGIEQGLAMAGIAPGRYRFAGMVDDLKATLLAENIDIYVDSAPVGGGRAVLEAMAARIPVIVPADPDKAPLITAASPIPGWVEISRPEDMANAIAECEALQAVIGADAHAQAVRAEFARFEDHIALRPLPPAGPSAGVYL